MGMVSFRFNPPTSRLWAGIPGKPLCAQGSRVAAHIPTQISQSVIFVFLITFTSMIPTLPLGIYQTFWLEAEHGFNKTTPTLYVTDMIKGWGLGLVIGTPLLAAFLYIFEWAGDRFLPWLMALLLVPQRSSFIVPSDNVSTASVSRCSWS